MKSFVKYAQFALAKTYMFCHFFTLVQSYLEGNFVSTFSHLILEFHTKALDLNPKKVLKRLKTNKGFHKTIDKIQ